MKREKIPSFLNRGANCFRINTSPDKVLFVKSKISIVVRTFRDIFWIRALAISIRESNFENCSKGTSIFSGSTRNANKVLPTILRVGMFGENSNWTVLWTLERASFRVLIFLRLLLAGLHLISPFAHPIFLIKSKSWSTRISVRKPIATVKESGTVFGIRKGSKQSWTIRCRNGWFNVTSFPTIYIMEIVTVLRGKCWVNIIKCKAIATEFQCGLSRFAVPVLVTTVKMRIKSFKFIWTLEFVFLARCDLC